MAKAESGRGGDVHDWLVEAKRALQEASDRLEGFSRLRKKLEAFLTDMDTPLTVAVVGEWNSGKSTFVNALLGADVLPVGCLPTTGCVTLLRYASEPGLIVRYRGGIERSARLEELKQLAAHNHGDGVGRAESGAVDSLAVFYPVEILRKAIFIDTPGLNAPTDADRAITERTLSESDVIVWLTSAQQVLSATQVDALTRYGDRYKGKSICVISQTDLLEDAEGQMKALLKHASDLLSGYFCDVVPVSARLALRGDEDQLRPFYRAFRNNIVQRTRYLKGSIALKNARTVVREEIAELERDKGRLTSLRKDLEETRSAAEYSIDEFVGAMKEVIGDNKPALERLRTSLVTRIHNELLKDYRAPKVWYWPPYSMEKTLQWALQELDILISDLEEKTSDLSANLVSNLEELNEKLMERIKRSSKRLDPPQPNSELQGLLVREWIRRSASFVRGFYTAGIKYGAMYLQSRLKSLRQRIRPSHDKIDELVRECLPFDSLDHWPMLDEDTRSEILMCYDRVEEEISGAAKSVNRDIQTLKTVYESLQAVNSLTGRTPEGDPRNPGVGAGERKAQGGSRSPVPGADAVERNELGLTGRRSGQRCSSEQKQRIMGEVERLRAEGKSVCAVLRKLGVPRSTYYYWRSENRASKSKTLPTA